MFRTDLGCEFEPQLVQTFFFLFFCIFVLILLSICFLPLDFVFAFFLLLSHIYIFFLFWLLPLVSKEENDYIEK